MTKNTLLIFLLFIVFCASSCRKKCTDPTNPKCENYDPCYGSKPVSAAFKVFEATPSSSWKGEWYNDYETDTFFRDAYFVANEEGANYTWTIGAEVYHTKQVSLSFINVAEGTIVPVTLIIEKEPNKKCHPNDDGRDTFTKNVLVAKSLVYKYFPTSPEIGEKWVFETSDIDTLTSKWIFNIRRVLLLTTDSLPYRQISFFNNIPKGLEINDTLWQIPYEIGGTKFRITRFSDKNSENTLCTYYIDGVYYDFKLQTRIYENNTLKNEIIRKFNAKRIQ